MARGAGELGDIGGAEGQALWAVLEDEGRDAQAGDAGVDVLVGARRSQDDLPELLGEGHPGDHHPGEHGRTAVPIHCRLEPRAPRRTRRIGRGSGRWSGGPHDRIGDFAREWPGNRAPGRQHHEDHQDGRNRYGDTGSGSERSGPGRPAGLFFGWVHRIAGQT